MATQTKVPVKAKPLTVAAIRKLDVSSTIAAINAIKIGLSGPLPKSVIRAYTANPDQAHDKLIELTKSLPHDRAMKGICPACGGTDQIAPVGKAGKVKHAVCGHSWLPPEGAKGVKNRPDPADAMPKRQRNRAEKNRPKAKLVEIGRAQKSAEGAARSWSDPATRAARSERNSVRVGGVVYRSLRAAFDALGLPLNRHQKFRLELKASKKATFEGKTFTLLDFQALGV